MSKSIAAIAQHPARATAILALVLAALVVGIMSASAVHDTNAMELDGNVIDDSGAGDPQDWDSIFDANGDPIPANLPAGAVITSFVKDFVIDAKGPDPSYHEPSNQDDQAILATGGSNVWGCRSHPNPTDKNDIINAYAIAVDAPDPVGGDIDRFLYFGGERFSNDGTAFMGMWFFQAPVACDLATNKFVNADDPSLPGKTTNDVFMLANFSRGGAPANINLTAFSWTAGPNPDDPGTFTPIGAAADARCSVASPGDDICAEVNFFNTFTTKWPFQDKKTPNGTTNGTVREAEFFEGGINLTDAFNLAGGAPPPCFSTWLMETRASDSITASLKDFALGEFNTCGKITIIKDTVPDAAQDFSYSTTGGLTPVNFDLDDDGNATLPNTKVYTNVSPATYTVTEGAVAGYDLTAINCTVDHDGGTSFSVDLVNREATINIGALGEVTCTFVNTERGKITIIKDTVPNGPTDFGYTTTGGLSPATFDLDDDADGTLSNTRVYNNIPTGAYTVTEDDPTPAFDLSDLSCTVDANPAGGTSASEDLVNRKATINIGPAGEVTCTYTNTQRGKVTIIKDTVPNGGQDFGYVSTGGLSPATFDLDDDADGTLSNTQVYNNVVPGGPFTVTEDDPTSDGFDLTNLSCTVDANPAGGTTASEDLVNRKATINIGPAGEVTCTYTNTQRGHIIVDKVTVPDPDPSNTSFSFTTTGTGYTGFSLTNAATPNDQELQPNAAYSVTETVPTGWSLTGLSCSSDLGTSSFSTSEPTATISNLAPGDTVRCTFTNTQLFKLIILTCDTTTEELVISSVDPISPASFNAVGPLDTIGTPPALAGNTEAELQAYLCGLGGASYDNLAEDVYRTDTTIPKP